VNRVRGGGGVIAFLVWIIWLITLWREPAVKHPFRDLNQSCFGSSEKSSFPIDVGEPEVVVLFGIEFGVLN
jgi:hypothetical protein